MLGNEKYCGDVLCQKTVTVDFFTHKVARNTGQEPQYFIEGHHTGIVDKDTWLRAQQVRKERLHSKHVRNKKPKAIQINFPAATAMIRKATGWSADETWNVPGVFIAEENALVYDLGAAYKPIAKGGWSARREMQAKFAEATVNVTNDAEGVGEK